MITPLARVSPAIERRATPRPALARWLRWALVAWAVVHVASMVQAVTR